jgi:hypothetical protein
MGTLAPIVLFVYDRPWHTQQTLEALKKNKLAEESELFIYSDAPKNEKAFANVQKVREYIKSIDGFKNITIIERKTNWGLANSVIDGTTSIINKYGKIIVLEDDLLTSISFLDYMNNALDKYKYNNQIFSITGFSFSEKFLAIPKNYTQKVYFHMRPMSWSWATWNDRWSDCDWDIKNFYESESDVKYNKGFAKMGPDLPHMLNLQFNKKIDSWYVRFCYNAYKNGMLTVYPINGLISNIGHDGSGVHCSIDENGKYLNIVVEQSNNINETFFPEEVFIEQEIIKRFNRNFVPKNIFYRVFKKISKKIR